jgi:hypothetical protein
LSEGKVEGIRIGMVSRAGKNVEGWFAKEEGKRLARVVVYEYESGHNK